MPPAGSEPEVSLAPSLASRSLLLLIATCLFRAFGQGPALTLVYWESGFWEFLLGLEMPKDKRKWVHESGSLLFVGDNGCAPWSGAEVTSGKKTWKLSSMVHPSGVHPCVSRQLGPERWMLTCALLFPEEEALCSAGLPEQCTSS